MPLAALRPVDHITAPSILRMSRLIESAPGGFPAMSRSGISRFVESDVLQFLKAQPAESFDAALFLEVAFFMPEYKQVLDELSRVLRPGGVILCSFWSLYYKLLGAVQVGDWESAKTLLGNRSGPLGGGSTVFCWHTGGDVVHDLSEAGFLGVSLSGLGDCSGIEGDPLASIARPSLLSPADRVELAGVEKAVAALYPDVGRYILATAFRKPNE